VPRTRTSRAPVGWALGIPMDQEEIINSLKEHLDSLRGIIRWALLLAVVFWWAGVQNEEIIKALGIEVKREQALFVAVIFYLLVNLTIFDKLWRIGDLVKLLDTTYLKKGLSKLALHPWEMNPFSFFGNTWTSKLHSSKGFGLLIIVWWVGNASLYSLSDNLMSSIGLMLQGLFLGIGLASMGAINRAYSIILKCTENYDPVFHGEIKSTQVYRALLTFLGIGVGGLVAFITMGLK